MTTDTRTTLYDSATDLYLGWVDASVPVTPAMLRNRSTPALPGAHSPPPR